jgi:glycosyltransferase involved in cell wall biosynthesis
MLIVSRYLAFDTARYAGSKTHNYYLKRFHKDFTVKLLTVADPSEKEHLDFEKYNIDASVIYVDEDPRRVAFFLLYNWKNIPNYFGKTAGVTNGYVLRRVLRELKALQKTGYCPECIVLEWTPIVFLAGKIKKLFPKAFIIASEHDVSFLRYQRQLKAATGMAQKIKEYVRFKSIKKTEIDALHRVDLIVPHNVKDRDLLISSGLAAGKIHFIAPFFSDYGNVRYNDESSSILYFGAMDRPENYECITWFIEKVFHPYLAHDFSLFVVGSKPHKSLEQWKSDKIIITGFVPDVREYMQRCVCKVAPLLSGAGIKVKVLEAMSAGLPVIANTIAIEGIPAKNGISYLHCETPREYADIFHRIRDKKIDLAAISQNAKKLMADVFNLDKSYESYKNAVLDMCNSGRVKPV